MNYVDAYNWCFKEKYAVPGIFPGISLSGGMRYHRDDLAQFGDVRPVDRYKETLEFLRELRQPSELLIDRKVEIWSKGVCVIRLDEDMTKPVLTKFNLEELSLSTFRLTLKKKMPNLEEPQALKVPRSVASVYKNYFGKQFQV